MITCQKRLQMPSGTGILLLISFTGAKDFNLCSDTNLKTLYRIPHFGPNNIHPDDHDLVINEIEKAIAGTAINWSMEYRFQRADKTYADVIDKGFFIRDGKGKQPEW